VNTLPSADQQISTSHYPRPGPVAASIEDELRLLSRVEAIAKHLRAIRLHAEALAVEKLGTMIEMFAARYRPGRLP
jgi:hypothetical protein